MTAVPDFERILADEGLAPVDVEKRSAPRMWLLSKNEDDERIAADRADAEQAAAEYLAWARAVAERPAWWFDTALQRQVWQLHAEGLSHNAVAERLQVRRRQVTYEVSMVKSLAGDAPPNPWRKSGKDRSTMAKEATAAVQQDEDWKPRKVAPEVFRYARILMREPIEIKGRSARHDRLLDIDGRPHVGGIDVMIGPDDFPGTGVVHQVITIPWWRIRQADRTGE